MTALADSNHWTHWLRENAPACVFADSPREVFALLREDCLLAGESRVLTVFLPEIPALEEILSHSLRAMAECTAKRMHDAVAPDRAMEALSRTARRLLAKGLPPLTPRHSLATQGPGIGKALSAEEFILVVASDERSPSDDRLFGLARVIEWLSGQCEMTAGVLLPLSLRRHESLDALNYCSFTIEEPHPVVCAEYTLHVLPGVPHPRSPGERKVAEQLARDPVLGSLFQFNRRVQTRFGNTPVVDLIWREGRLVVEIDGFHTHTTRTAFASDRRRDYELLASGYRVLRLTHDEAESDTASAVEKIRDLVCFIRDLKGVEE